MSECMEIDKCVQILLSTYNGEEYLQEQLNSYLTQKIYNHCKVLIRDDGSTDGTKDILKEYETKYGFEVNYGENIGVTGSYQWLIEHSDKNCDYFALSDQDDVWLPEKLCIAYKYLENEPEDIPVLFASRSQITDDKLNPLGKSIIPERGISFYNIMLQNVFSGHTQVLNRTLCTILAQKGIEDAHVVDWWISLVAAGIGKLVFYPEITVLHRQHIDNAVGYVTGSFGGIKKKIGYVFDGKGHEITRQLNAFYYQYKKHLSQDYLQELERFLKGSDSVLNGLQYILHHNAFRQKFTEDIMFAILYLLKAYKL